MQVQEQGAAALMQGIERPFLIFASQAISAQQQEDGNRIASPCQPRGQRHTAHVEKVDAGFSVIVVKQMIKQHQQDCDALDDCAVLL